MSYCRPMTKGKKSLPLQEFFKNAPGELPLAAALPAKPGEKAKCVRKGCQGPSFQFRSF